MMFSYMNDLFDLANYINVSYDDLKFVLFSKNNYFTFTIPKKRKNEFRNIDAPKEKLSLIQHKLNEKLSKIYNVSIPKSVNGFIKNRSIITNAKCHLQNKFLLNLDLKDFFPNITFIRVKNLFMKQPFNANEKVANLIANLLTHDGKLPQGACTSPLISNMICRRMDHRFEKFCKKNEAVYTRYADDISISWNDKNDTNKFFNILKNQPSDIINIIISEEGFLINERKTFFANKNCHKEVTGIIINKYLNTPKRYYYKLRAILNDILKNGWNSSCKNYCEKNNIKQITDIRLYKQIVLGYFNYYKMVVDNDELPRQRYNKLAKNINFVFNSNIFDIRYDLQSLSKNGSFLFYSDDSKDSTIINLGTIFRYKGYLITCKHCLFNEDDLAFYEKEDTSIRNNIQKKYKWFYSADGLYESKIELTNPIISDKYDLAFFKNNNLNEKSFIISDIECKYGDIVHIVGYPDASKNDFVSVLQTCIEKEIEIDKLEYYKVQDPVFNGASGAPLINSNNIVCGICVYGQEKSKYDGSIIENGILKSKYLLEEIQKIK